MLKLKRVEIQGFKSFFDRTELKFNGDGIAAIVGPNGCGKTNIVDAIREVNAGRRYLPRSVAARLHENQSGAHLTRREDEILDLLGKGLGNRELGQVLGVSEDTIKTHARRLFKKLGARDRAHAVAVGFRYGFVA